MPDVFTRSKRSEVMSRIRARGNRDTELRMIALFRQYRIIGWRRNARVFGKPDFVFLGEKIAVFVDGCFWHRHPRCKFAYTPKSRLEFWLRKFRINVARDKAVTLALRKNAWKVLRVWECDLSPKKAHVVAQKMKRLLDERRAMG